MAPSLTSKDKFFASLDTLDDESTVSEDEPLREERKKRLKTEDARPKTLKTPSLGRSVTVQETWPTRSIARQPPRRSNSEPEGHRTKAGLFQHLIFYFVPNDNVAPVRRRRIQSAIQQGAIWKRDLKEDITHVIVDSHLAAGAVARLFKGRINFSDVHIVKDNWLVECLTHKSLRDPSAHRFQVKDADKIFGKANEPECPVTGQASATECNREDVKVTPLQKVTAVAATDALHQIIQDLQQADRLPFDAEVDLKEFISDDDGRQGGSGYEPSFSNEAGVLREDRGFSCMEPNNGRSSDGLNKRTIEILQQMATYYDRVGDNWRTLAYRKAVNALDKQKELVATKNQACKIYGIGSRLADKIEEIVSTDRLQRLESVSSDPNDKALQIFMGIYGAGLTQAKLWMDQGYRTLEDLRDKATLTPNQQIGLDHYDDLQQRIPRAEVKMHGDVVQKALLRVNKDLEAVVGGSYRRGMPDSGDIDVMIMHPTAELAQLQAWVFDVVIPYLFEIGFLKCALATSHTSKKQARTTPAKSQRQEETTPGENSIEPISSLATGSDGGSKFHGASCLPDSTVWRRIDLLLVPACSRGAAMIYFTGNDIFNRSIRLLASRKGMRLNQHGLYRNVLRGPGRVKQTEGELVEGRDEKKIFEILGVPWREPEERRC
ncbi:hypothetical protein LTR64_006083 [Lithohypha guttulata]|uniref:uncharacterized protein n=1 Tax=Lithohypha guttulata TaxID=1690604 RepID=UPI002DDE2FE8|nr:hypothetical protein LTR51_002119 [Lithohypha guttulata]